MLWQPALTDNKWQAQNATGRPAAAWGDLVTPGTNTKGSWVQLFSGAEVEHDVFGIMININSNSLSATSRQLLVDIGVDNAGGSSYVVKIPDLYATNASAYNVGAGGVWFYFPLYIKAGSTIAARGAAVSSANTFNVFATIMGQPAHPENIKTGSFVQAFAATPASSSGVAITPGTTSEGAWVELGTLTEDLWWWQVGLGQNDTSTQLAAIHLDLAVGDATNKRIIVQDLLVTNATAEAQGNPPLQAGCVGYAAAGTKVYGRAQTSGTADTSVSMIAYGLGG